MTIYDRSYTAISVSNYCRLLDSHRSIGGYRYGPNTRGPNYAAYEVRMNGQCVKNVPYSDLSIARVKFCEICSALPLAVKFVLVRRCI